MRVVVTAHQRRRQRAATSAATAAVVAAPPVNTARRRSPAPPRDGQTLTADRRHLDRHARSTYAYQWQRCDAAGATASTIAGATGTTYTLTAADVGSTIRVVVTATNAGGIAAAIDRPERGRRRRRRRSTPRPGRSPARASTARR